MTPTPAHAYRVEAGAVADGDDARAPLTTGYFAQAASATMNPISTAARIADFSAVYMRSPSHRTARPVRLGAGEEHAGCQTEKRRVTRICVAGVCSPSDTESRPEVSARPGTDMLCAWMKA